jgi:hypothetical protein
MATVSFQQGVNGYTSALDTMLKQASPAAGSGTATTLRVDAGTGVEVQTLLGFDNLFGSGAGQIPLGATITSASLTLQTTNGSNNSGSLYRMVADWDNASTWNSLTNGVQTNGSEAVATADATVGVATTGSSKVVDVTKSLQAWASAGTTAEAHNAANQGWLFKTPSTDAWDFDSSEGTTRPLLSVTYTLDGTPPSNTASVVKVTDLTSSLFQSADATGFGIGDPSGLAYVPGTGKLFIADSEHDERPYFSSSNLFSTGPNGAVQAYSLTSFTIEPTGIGYNPNNGFLYITDDDKQEVFWVDSANPSKKVGQFDTASLGFLDSEDPKFDPVTGHMFMLDGSLKKLFELTDQGALVRAITLPTVMKDAEALAYDPTHEVFFVASGKSTNIWELDRDGNILATINVLGSSSYVNPITGVKPVPKGLELAPSSDPNDGNKMNLYVADYGVDQVNDGRLFEIDLGSGWLIA